MDFGIVEEGNETQVNTTLGIDKWACFKLMYR